MTTHMTPEEQIRRLEVSVREALNILKEDGQFASVDARSVLRGALERSMSRSLARKEMTK